MREYLTGCALIALAIERAASNAHSIANAINRLSPHDDPRRLERRSIEPQSPYDMAMMAVTLADACLAELDKRTPDPFSDQMS